MPTSIIQDYLNRSKTATEIKAFLRYMVEKEDMIEPGAVGLNGITDGQTLEVPLTGVIWTRIDDSDSREGSELTVVLKAGDYANSEFLKQHGSSKRRRFNALTGVLGPEVTYPEPDRAWAAFPDLSNSNRTIFPNGDRWSYIDFGGGSGDYAVFSGLVIGDGDQGTSGWSSLKYDGNEPRRGFIAGQIRYCTAMTNNSRLNDVFVGDIINGVILMNQTTGVSPSIETEIVAVSFASRTPWDAPGTLDYGYLGPGMDHLVFLLNGGGTVAREFDGTEMATQILPTSPHTDGYWYTKRDGSRYRAAFTKGTPGQPKTGQGDAIHVLYDFTTDGTTGVRDVNIVEDIQAFDAAASYSQGFTGQISASQVNDDYLLMMTVPHDGYGATPYYGRRAAVLIPINEKWIPPGEVNYPLCVCHHGENSTSFQRQTEGNIGPSFAYPDPNAGEQHFSIRSSDEGENTNHYMVHVRFGGIPTKAGTDDPDWVLWFSYVARVTLANSGTDSFLVGESRTFSVDSTVSPVSTLLTYDWRVDGVTESTGTTLNHTFSSVGTFLVQLWVVDDVGKRWSSTCFEIVVSAAFAQYGVLKSGGSQNKLIKVGQGKILKFG